MCMDSKETPYGKKGQIQSRIGELTTRHLLSMVPLIDPITQTDKMMPRHNARTLIYTAKRVRQFAN